MKTFTAASSAANIANAKSEKAPKAAMKIRFLTRSKNPAP
jgi:hypothetical protein